MQFHFGMLTYQNVYINETQSVKFWRRYNNSDMNDRQLCMKIPKKHNIIKGRSITCSHMWYIDTPKCVY